MANAGYKLLLIEDNELDQMAFKRFVEHDSLPYDCTIAGSVKEARSILNDKRFDIIIADYSLGDGTAFDILDSVKDTPIILVTGVGDEETAIKAWKAGAYDYLVKDIDRNYLKTVPITIENAIGYNRTKKKLQLLSGAVMSTDDSVFITDMENEIIFVNKAFCETYGYAEEEILGKDSDILWMDQGRSGNADNVLQTGAVGSSWGVGFYHRRKDRTIFPVFLSRSAIKDSDGNEVAMVGIARDISEQILIEDQLRTINAKLRTRYRQSSEMAVTISEELKTSLVEGQIDRAKSITDDFLTVSKIDTGKMKIERTEFDFTSVVRQVLEAASPLATQRDIELKNSMPDQPLPVNADCDKIVQVLTNLIERALMSAQSGGQVNVRIEDTGNQIAAEIQNDGPVLDSDEIQSIFDRSAWSAERLKHEQESLGLGLPIAKELIEMHEGCLWAEGGQAQGNTVCFTLPKSPLQQKVPIPAASPGAP